MIRFENFNYWYPDQTSPALAAVNFNVNPGEFVLLAGQSGSGKSTFLRAINGLVPHFTGGRVAGSVLVGGVDPVAAGPEVMSRQVGFVAQDPESQGVLDTVEAEIAFPLENAAVPPSEMRIRVEEVLDLLGLARLRQRPLAQLSGGERQRVAIATALVFRPSVLLLDEPTSQLDPQSAEDVLRALVRLNEDLALTIVLAEHRLERILAYVDRVTYVEGGKIAVDAPAREAVATMPGVPPLVELARSRNWRPIPLTVKEARPFVAATDPVVLDGKTSVSASANGNGSVTNLLAVDQLSYAFGDRQVLSNVSLQVNAGEAVALVGRNGSGKTTLLRSIVGLLPAYRGAVTLHGRPTRGRSVAEICRQVGYLPQNPDDLLYAETVREELALTLDNHGQPIDAADIDQWLADLGLSEVGERYPRDLSVGQRQRVALGAITVTRPSLVLLDEPTRGLDGAAKLSLAALLQKWQRAGTGLLIVSHDVEFVAIIANRAIMLAEGEVIADGATQDVLGASPQFAPQIARLLPGRGWLTVQDALEGLQGESQGSGQCQS